MATTFLEPGGDATFNTATTNGFWSFISGSPISSTIVHGKHQKSFRYGGAGEILESKNNVLADAGTRFSFYIYLDTKPSSNGAYIAYDGGGVWDIQLTTAGVLQLGTNGTQIGTNGITLSTGKWYRICLAYTITSSTINRFELFVNSISTISVTNATLFNTLSSNLIIGNGLGNASLVFYSSDHYVDNSSSLTDTGDIWVTAKRPNANGTTNGFTTQIGAGGSGYGTGHTPQVNERPLSTTNGWSMVGTGSAITEEYNIETYTVGDINLYKATIVDWLGWASMSSLVGETVQMVVGGANFAQAITSTITLYTKIKGSTTYPAGTGTDIGITTDTSLTTVSLYECGIVVAYIPGSIIGPFPTHLP